MSEVTATDHVHALVDAGEVSEAIADRLDDNGYETIADLLIADQADLEDVPYVGGERAADILDAVEDIEPDSEPLVDSHEVVLDATLGEQLQVTLAERDAWATPWTVIEAPEPTEWESGADGTWMTRRLRLSESASGQAKKARECDLVLVDDEIRIEDPPVKRRSHQPDAPGWGVESVGAVGRVSTVSLAQLKADDDQSETKPEGDDTYRKYQLRGEA